MPTKLHKYFTCVLEMSIRSLKRELEGKNGLLKVRVQEGLVITKANTFCLICNISGLNDINFICFGLLDAELLQIQQKVEAFVIARPSCIVPFI